MTDAAHAPHEHDRRQAPYTRAGTFLFQNASAEAVTQALQAFGAVARPYAPAATEVFWVYPAAEPTLQMYVIHAIADFEIDLIAGTYWGWWLPLKDALGAGPASALQVQLADGEAAAGMISRLATFLLGQYGGIVQDDNSAHAWTLDEIRAEVVIDGYRFFQPRRRENSYARDH